MSLFGSQRGARELFASSKPAGIAQRPRNTLCVALAGRRGPNRSARLVRPSSLPRGTRWRKVVNSGCKKGNQVVKSVSAVISFDPEGGYVGLDRWGANKACGVSESALHGNATCRKSGETARRRRFMTSLVWKKHSGDRHAETARVVAIGRTKRGCKTLLAFHLVHVMYFVELCSTERKSFPCQSHATWSGRARGAFGTRVAPRALAAVSPPESEKVAASCPNTEAPSNAALTVWCHSVHQATNRRISVTF